MLRLAATWEKSPLGTRLAFCRLISVPIAPSRLCRLASRKWHASTKVAVVFVRLFSSYFLASPDVYSRRPAVQVQGITQGSQEHDQYGQVFA